VWRAVGIVGGAVAVASVGWLLLDRAFFEEPPASPVDAAGEAAPAATGPAAGAR
jgi:hypothetical protein